MFKKGYKPSKETIEKVRQKNLGRKLSEEHKKKIKRSSTKHWLGKKRPDISGENNYLWKGDDVGYFALHAWIKRHKGKPKICIHCGATYKEHKLHWANVDHKYRRVLDDYISLCVSCHRKYDYKNNNYKKLK